MAYKARRDRKRAAGGKADTEPLNPEHGHQYNAQGSPEEKEESAKSDGFKRGGAMKRKAGGKVEGHAAKRHLGKRARGGATPPHLDIHLGDHHEHDGHDGPHMGHHTDGDRHDGHHSHGSHEGHGHAAHRARGGHVGHKAMARGGSPFSSAQKTKPPMDSKESGPGEQAPMIP